MKNVLKTLLVITLFTLSLAFAGMQVNELLFVPWGEANNEVRHESYPGLHTGPLSFQVQESSITVFDTENKELKTFYGNGSFSSEKLTDPYIVDFYRSNDDLYLLTPQTIYVKNKNATHLISALDDPRDMFSGIKMVNGSIQVSHQNAKVQCTPPALNKGQVSDITVTRTLPSSLNVRIGSALHTINIPEIGSVDYIGSTPENDHYIYAETITSHAPLAVARQILLINNEGKVLATLHLPPQQYTYIFKEFSVGENGELYHMQSSKDGIHILEWTMTDDDQLHTYYPPAYSDAYHFNQFSEAEPQSELAPFLMKTTGDAITRAEALSIGDEFVTHTWTATSANIGTTATVTTPSWIQVGPNTRVPYKWGGYNTIASFDEGIAAGQLAGDINTSVVDYGNSVGSDCSGFVSRCWTSGRYTTSSFYQTSTQLSSYNDLLPADATNKAGSHIRMVVEWTNDGKLVQIEETASGNPGWAARYYTWTLSQISDYVPIRYNNILNSSAPRPTLLSIESKTDSMSLNWTADESGIFTGYRVYRKTISQSNYHVIAQVAKGTQTLTVPQTNDIQYDYFVAAYNASDSANFNASDVYAAKATVAGREILIVDGFDRYSGSYGSPVHEFVRTTANAMDEWDIAYGSCANEAVISGDVDLKDYDLVWWICGDESTADETFSDIEQDSVEAYLKQGGKLFVSGSEIGWDLDSKGSTSDKAFIHDYLKATYAGDDAENYSVTGQAGMVFSPLSLRFSENGNEEDTYAEDYPDYFSVSGGSQIALKYGNGHTAGLAFTGTFSGGSEEGKVVTMGFPFETITTTIERQNLAGYVLQYMGYDLVVNTQVVIPQTCELYQNYPNPFNPLTTIAYRLDKPALVNIKIFDIRGELVQTIVQGTRNAGEHEVIFDGTNLASGLYVYRLDINNEAVATGKMILNK